MLGTCDRLDVQLFADDVAQLLDAAGLIGRCREAQFRERLTDTMSRVFTQLMPHRDDPLRETHSLNKWSIEGNCDRSADSLFYIPRRAQFLADGPKSGCL